MRTWLAALIALAVLLPGAATPAGRATVLVAHPVRTLTSAEGIDLKMPTGVAVGPGGQVWVADGVRDRVVSYRADGSVAFVVKGAAGKSLLRPTGVDVTADGRAFIADADRRRVVIVSADGATSTVLAIDPALTPGLDMTDLAVTPDGRRVWIVDNDHHRVIVGDLASGIWVPLGKRGRAWGQFSYPYGVALDEGGGAHISDVLNGRLGVFTSDGLASQAVSRFGAGAGQLYRPKGVAIRDGTIWVSDGALGVIQLFSSRGRFLDALRDEGGAVLRLANPAGIEVVGDLLYVAEVGRSRVQVFRIEEVAGTPLRSAGSRGGGMDRSKARDCSPCHLGMVPELSEGGQTALAGPVLGTDAQPYVSREETCLSCHDGAIMDSRRTVWDRFGHPVGEDLPDDMVVPEELPLVNGQLGCRTCHTAHALGGSGQQHRDAVLLRVTDRPSELCAGCHSEKVPEGPALLVGHPLGEVVPGDAGVERVECLDCHGAHGVVSEDRQLRRREAESCEDCHEAQRSSTAADHPRGVRVTSAAAIAAIEALGGQLEGAGRIVCVTCHDAHGDIDVRELCAACHDDSASHDTGHGGDDCAACHSPHRSSGTAEVRRPSPGDPTGCLSCHGPGKRAQEGEDQPGMLGHALLDQPGGLPQSDPPLEGCPSCHDSEFPGRGDSSLCERCHDEQAAETLLGGHGEAVCLDCHPVHHERPTGPESKAALNPFSQRCLACHADDATDGDAPRQTALQHPDLVFEDDGPAWTTEGVLPLYGPGGNQLELGVNGDLSCGSCHLTHGPDPEQPGTARRRPGWQQDCQRCHGPTAIGYYLYFHQPQRREKGLMAPR